ncbi:MAG: class I SAM-dependent methyltransferase [Phycisphaerae bacterium]|nr:class I SAM-dependent methyltransferase [Phycisphaerae bacterium]
MKLVSAIHGLAVRGGRAVRLAQAVEALCPDGPQKMLDIGCGDGRIANILSQRLGPRCEVVGIDVLVRDGAEIPVTQYDGRTIPFEDNSFDTVLLIDVLHHTNNAAWLLKEAARVARDCVIVKDHVCESGTDRRLLSFMDWVGNRPGRIALEYNYLSAADWDDCLASAGLVSEHRTTDVKLYRWPLSAVFHRRMHVLMKLVAGGD